MYTNRRTDVAKLIDRKFTKRLDVDSTRKSPKLCRKCKKEKVVSNLRFVEYIRGCGDMLAITFRDCEQWKGLWADREILPRSSHLNYESSSVIPSDF